MDKKDINEQIKVLELLNKEFPEHYPKGSMIVFVAQNTVNEDSPEKDAIFNCSWYDKKGEGFPLKNMITKPPELQGITFKEAEKICLMFDSSIVVCRSIAIAHDYGKTELGVKLANKENE